MGENGKRSRPQRESDSDGKYQKRRANNKDNSGGGELVVYRILCPGGIIGSVIGKSGKVINSLRQETHARIKVVDPFPGVDERVVTIYCFVKDKDDKEVDEYDSLVPLCPAQDALLKVHSAIVKAMSAVGDSDKRNKEEAHILVPSSQAANVIGKSGSTIKKLRTKTETNIKFTPKDPNDPTHSCAMSFDNFVRITGDPDAVKKALYAVSAIMYKFSPKEEISLETVLPDLPPTIIIPSEIPIYPTGSLYSSSDVVVPPRSVPPVMGATPPVTENHGYTDTGSTWPLYSSSLPTVPAYGGPSQSKELIVRVLCPSNNIGRVIGKGGSSIKSVRQSSGARVEVNDLRDNCDETVITITSMESSDDLKSTAVEAVLLLQGKINVNDDDDKVNIRLLVPSKIIGCLIGKNGSIINEMRKKTKADVRISKKEKEKPKCAGEEDSLVEVIGDVGSVRDALVQIILRLRDYVLKDREGDQSAPIADSRCSSGYSAPSVLPSVPPVAPFGYDQRVDTGGSLGMLSSRSMYGYGSLQVGENGYESIPSYSSKLYEGFSSTREIVIPAHAVSKVMGKGGANIANIQKISGAVVEILDSKFSYSECVAYVSGTPEQKREAENLIEAFILAT